MPRPKTIEDAFRVGVLPDILRRFVVNDLTQHLFDPWAGPKLIMLLESPHINEVLAGHPLAGRSGRNVLNAWFQTQNVLNAWLQIPNSTWPDDCTLGEVLRYQLLTVFPTFKRVGVMNVSRLPLQKKTYPYSVQRKLPKDLLPTYETIREHPFRPRRKEERRNFDKLIYDDLYARIMEVCDRLGRDRPGNDNVEFISFGDVARAYLNFLPGDVRVSSHTFPHPSALAWVERMRVS